MWEWEVGGAARGGGWKGSGVLSSSGSCVNWRRWTRRLSGAGMRTSAGLADRGGAPVPGPVHAGRDGRCCTGSGGACRQARRAAERDEADIAAWRQETWPVKKGRPRGRAPGWSSRTSRQGLRPPKGRTWGRRGRTGDDGDRRQQRESVAGRADRGAGIDPADLLRPRSAGVATKAQGVHRDGLRPAALLASSSRPIVLVWDNLNTHVSRAMGELIAPGLADGLPAARLCLRAQPRRDVVDSVRAA